MKRLIGVSFGYEKGRYSKGLYDIYVHQWALFNAKRIAEREDFRTYEPDTLQGIVISSFCLQNGCIIEFHPKIKYVRNGAHYEHDKPSIIKFATEPRNVARLRGLLAKLKLPSDVKFKPTF